MSLKELWEDFKTKLKPKREEPAAFGLKNCDFILQSNDGFQITVDRPTAFQSLRLQAIIKEKGYEDPMGKTFGTPILLSGIKNGKALELVIKWTMDFMRKTSTHHKPIYLISRCDNYKILASLKGWELIEMRDVADYLDIPLVLEFLLEVIQFIKVVYLITEDDISKTESIEKWIFAASKDARIQENCEQIF